MLGLAPATQLDLADAAFTTGLLSVLDTFMHTTLEEAAARLPLSAEVEQALVNRVGRLGAILEAVLSYEQGDLAGPDPFPLPVGTLRDAYLHAVSSATQVTAALS